MNITDAKAWLTARSSRVRTEGGQVVIGIPLDVAAEIADLIKIDTTPAPEYDLIPKAPEPTAMVVEAPVVVVPTPEVEKVVDTESGPVKIPSKKAAKKKKKRRGKR